ncbi:MAG: VanZ family protein [Candidatus Syntrophonatronum acetioxidans]|uniref:VanZ family protein n=1 Tax=Candidatus Syntrophonatronum acetioxidans TaxID=1795816 RepID=A0A424YEQ8_9FIRM|nr:MAG: VanZ family protein [Candidatus Syntrophonatronum acetioxidans]
MERRNFPRDRAFILASIICVAWVLFIFSLSFQSYQEQDLQPYLKERVPRETLEENLPRVEFRYSRGIQSYREPYRFIHFIIRKGAHLVIYAFLALLLVYQQLLHKRDPLRAFTRALIMLVVIAILDEGIQYFHEDRSGMIEDVILDLWGSIFVLGWLAFRGRDLRRPTLTGSFK